MKFDRDAMLRSLAKLAGAVGSQGISSVDRGERLKPVSTLEAANGAAAERPRPADSFPRSS